MGEREGGGGREREMYIYAICQVLKCVSRYHRCTSSYHVQREGLSLPAVACQVCLCLGMLVHLAPQSSWIPLHPNHLSKQRY